MQLNCNRPHNPLPFFPHESPSAQVMCVPASPSAFQALPCPTLLRPLVSLPGLAESPHLVTQAPSSINTIRVRLGNVMPTKEVISLKSK